jgi:hypothetical protein
MPDCLFFQKGECRKGTKCKYRHVKLAVDASICKAFQRGYCPQGRNCTQKHLLSFRKTSIEGNVENDSSHSKYHDSTLTDSAANKNKISQSGIVPDIHNQNKVIMSGRIVTIDNLEHDTDNIYFNDTKYADDGSINDSNSELESSGGSISSGSINSGDEIESVIDDEVLIEHEESENISHSDGGSDTDVDADMHEYPLNSNFQHHAYENDSDEYAMEDDESSVDNTSTSSRNDGGSTVTDILYNNHTNFRGVNDGSFLSFSNSLTETEKREVEHAPKYTLNSAANMEFQIDDFNSAPSLISTKHPNATSIKYNHIIPRFLLEGIR